MAVTPKPTIRKGGSTRVETPPFTVEELPQTVVIDVTDRDIETGVPADAHRCAVARAVERRFDSARVSVTKESVYVWFPDGSGAHYYGGEALRDTVYGFDLYGKRFKTRSLRARLRREPRQRFVKPISIVLTRDDA